MNDCIMMGATTRKARMAKLADAADLKSAGLHRSWGFKSPSGHHKIDNSQLRHANSRIMLEIYARAISATKREANNKVVEMLIAGDSASSPAPSDQVIDACKKGAEIVQHPRGGP